MSRYENQETQNRPDLNEAMPEVGLAKAHDNEIRSRMPIYMMVILMSMTLILGGFNLYLLACLTIMTLVFVALIYQVFSGVALEASDDCPIQ